MQVINIMNPTDNKSEGIILNTMIYIINERVYKS